MLEPLYHIGRHYLLELPLRYFKGMQAIHQIIGYSVSEFIHIIFEYLPHILGLLIDVAHHLLIAP